MIDLYSVPLELQHHGVKGMKWGVTKSRVTKSAGRTKRSSNLDRKVTRRISKNNAKERHQLYKLSDADLQKKLNRINMENNYNQAVAKNLQLTRGRGNKALRKFAKSNYGKSVMRDTLNSGVKLATKVAVTAAI